MKTWQAGLFAMMLGIPLSIVDAASDTQQSSTLQSRWDSGKATSTILATCAIDGSLFRLDRYSDGYARIEASPSLTPDQNDCVAKTMADLKITPRTSQTGSVVTATAPLRKQACTTDTIFFYATDGSARTMRGLKCPGAQESGPR